MSKLDTVFDAYISSINSHNTLKRRTSDFTAAFVERLSQELEIQSEATAIGSDAKGGGFIGLDKDWRNRKYLFPLSPQQWVFWVRFTLETRHQWNRRPESLKFAVRFAVKPVPNGFEVTVQTDYKQEAFNFSEYQYAEGPYAQVFDLIVAAMMDKIDLIGWQEVEGKLNQPIKLYTQPESDETLNEFKRMAGYLVAMTTD